jgi:hypothetical protein
MDYSLLIGVVRRKFEVMDRATSLHSSSPEFSSPDVFQRDADGGMHAAVVEGPGTYYMGIIDVLQEWNWEKKLERFFKIYFKWMDGDGLSAAPPQQYVDRFMKRCVVEVFDGLYMSDSDFNPKMRNLHGGYRGHGGSRAVAAAAANAISGHDLDGEETRNEDSVIEDENSLALSADRFRATTGIDRRFSAAPLDNCSPLLQTAASSAPHSNRSTHTGGTSGGHSRLDLLEEGKRESELVERGS